MNDNQYFEQKNLLLFYILDMHWKFCANHFIQIQPSERNYLRPSLTDGQLVSF